MWQSSWFVFLQLLHYIPHADSCFQKVIVGSLDDWQKRRWIRVLNDKEERGVIVIRSGVKCVIDVKELLVGDIALLRPGEIIPCDGIFISGHNVKWDESGATGESDTLKKVGYDDRTVPREQAKREGADIHGFDAPNVHTDYFMVSGAKILEGYGKYVIIAVGQKSFNGRIMTGMLHSNFLFCLYTLNTLPVSSSPRRSRSHPITGEAERSRRAYRQDRRYCGSDIVHRSHDSLLRSVGYWGSRTVSVHPLAVSVFFKTPFCLVVLLASMLFRLYKN